MIVELMRDDIDMFDVVGDIEFEGKQQECKNECSILGRWSLQVGVTVYALDMYACLYRVEWQDIIDGGYGKTLVKDNVVNFCIDKEQGLATLNMNHTLSLPSGAEVDLREKMAIKVEWTIVACIAKYWIVCGDRESQSIVASISKQGYVTSMLKVKLTANGYRKEIIRDEEYSYDGAEDSDSQHKMKEYVIEYERMKYAGIHTLHQVFARGRKGITMAIERDGFCHLICLTYGRMSKLQSLDLFESHVFDREEGRKNHCVTSVTATGTKGEFIIGGMREFNRRMCLNLK